MVFLFVRAFRGIAGGELLSTDTQFTAQNTLVVIILPLHAVGDKHPTYQTHIIHTLTSVTVLLQLVKKETALEGIGYSCS